MGAPYALSSDLVSAWQAKSLEVAQYIDGQLPLIAMTQNAQTGTTYTLAATDFTRLVTLSNASPVTVTVPLESSVPWVAGTQLRLMNLGAGAVTVVGAGGVTINGSPLTLAQYKDGTLTKTGTNAWVFAPSGGSGKILQVVQGTTTTSTTSTSATYADTTLTVSITPTLATSKVLILVAQNLAYDGVGDTVIDLRIVRDATAVSTLARYIQSNGSQSSQGSFAASYLDSPNTTAATTYKTQFSRASGSNTIYAQNVSAPSTIIVMEVAA